MPTCILGCTGNIAPDVWRVQRFNITTRYSRRVAKRQLSWLPVTNLSDPHYQSPPSRFTSFPFFYGWIVLAVAGLALFASGPGQTFSISVFIDPIIEDTGWSRTLVSGMYTAGSLTGAVAMVLVGRLLDRYGARTMLVAVAFLFGIAVASMSAVRHPAQLYAGFVGIRALGQGSLTLIPTTLVSIWFIRLRGRAIAVTALGGMAGWAAFPAIIHLLISESDWRQAWIVLGIVVWGILLLPSLIFVRRSPESIGLLPDGDRPQGQSTSKETTVRHSPDDWTLSEALRTRTFWLLLFAISSPALITTAMSFHHMSIITSRGGDSGLAATILGFMAPVALCTSFVAGYLVDKVPNRYVVAGTHAILAGAMLWSLQMSGTWQVFIYGGMLGTVTGFNTTTTAVIWANYYGRGALGSIRGVAQVGLIGFAALGPLPFGFMFDLTDTYKLPVGVFLVLPVAAGTAALLARSPHRRPST